MKKITLLKMLFVIIVLILTNSNLKDQTLVAHYKFDGNLNDETTTYNLSETNGFPTPAAYEAGHLI